MIKRSVSLSNISRKTSAVRFDWKSYPILSIFQSTIITGYFMRRQANPVKRYVDRRRMADAAAVLVRTDARILDIAL